MKNIYFTLITFLITSLMFSQSGKTIFIGATEGMKKKGFKSEVKSNKINIVKST